MIYMLYADGSYNKEKDMMSYGYCVRSKKYFYRMGCDSIKGGNSGLAEAVAVSAGLSYIEKNIKLEPEDRIEVYTDSQYICNVFQTYHRQGSQKHVKQNRYLRRLDNLLTRMRQTNEVELKRTKGHQVNYFNANKLVDRLAKYALQRGLLEDK